MTLPTSGWLHKLNYTTPSLALISLSLKATPLSLNRLTESPASISGLYARSSLIFTDTNPGQSHPVPLLRFAGRLGAQPVSPLPLTFSLSLLYQFGLGFSPLSPYRTESALVCAFVCGRLFLYHYNFVTFIDEASRYVTFQPIKNKSNSKYVFIRYHSWCQRKHNGVIKRLHSDGGGEYKALFPYPL